MKEKLKQDFSLEVQALEDEIEALRNTYDRKVYTTDEGIHDLVLKNQYSMKKCIFIRSWLEQKPLTDE